MVVRAVTNCTVWSSDGQGAAVILVSRSVSVLRRFVHDLIEGWEDVVGELDLGDYSCTSGGHSDTEANNALLTERGVEYSVSSILFVETKRAPKNTSKFDIFSKKHGRLVFFHSYIHRVVNSRKQVHLFLVLCIL